MFYIHIINQSMIVYIIFTLIINRKGENGKEENEPKYYQQEGPAKSGIGRKSKEYQMIFPIWLFFFFWFGFNWPITPTKVDGTQLHKT